MVSAMTPQAILTELVAARNAHTANLTDPKTTTAAFIASRDRMLKAWAAAELPPCAHEWDYTVDGERGIMRCSLCGEEHEYGPATATAFTDPREFGYGPVENAEVTPPRHSALDEPPIGSTEFEQFVDQSSGEHIVVKPDDQVALAKPSARIIENIVGGFSAFWFALYICAIAAGGTVISVCSYCVHRLLHKWKWKRHD